MIAVRDILRRVRSRRLLRRIDRRWVKRLAIMGFVSAGVGIAGLAAAWYLSPFPTHRLDRRPASPLVTDRTGREMLSLVGPDDQWRFPQPLSQISPWLVQATIAVEDQRFRSVAHAVNPSIRIL